MSEREKEREMRKRNTERKREGGGVKMVIYIISI